MEYKYLTRKQYILDGGLKEKGLDTIVPFANMEVEVVDTFVPGDKVTLATEEKMEELVNGSIADSHKVIVGEYEVSTVAEFEQFITDYTAGKDHTLSNGRVFNNGNATPGEVVFITPKPGTAVNDFYTEELIVGATKQLINLSRENDAASRWLDLQNQINTANIEIGLKDYSTQVDAKVKAETDGRYAADLALGARIDTAQNKADANEGDITTLKADVIRIDEKDVTQDGRLEALEAAESLDDKVWTGSVTGADTINLNLLTDQNGDTFDFAVGKKLEIVMERTSDAVEQGQDIVVDSANATPYGLGTAGFTAKISSAGFLTLVKPAGAGNISDFALVRMVEALGAPAINTGYTKNESDAKYATLTALDIVDKKVDAIDLTGKQDTVDNSLTTVTKSVVGAINELDGKIKINDPLVARLGGLKTTDGDDLSTTTEAIVTDKTITARGYMTKAEVDAAIAAALSTVMDVTFDDTSTGQYKLGK